MSAVRAAYSSSDCAAGERFQRADLTAQATFSDGSTRLVGDVTALLTFLSSDTSVATVDGDALLGVASGSVQVSLSLPSTVLSAEPVAVAVGGSLPLALVQQLSVIVFTAGSWTA